MWTGVILFLVIHTVFIFSGCLAAFQPTKKGEPCVPTGLSTVARGACMVCAECDHNQINAMNCTRDGERYVGDEQQLYEDLFPGQRYNVGLRPLRNSSDQVKVFFTMQVKQIVDITWDDKWLKWNPDDYGGLKELRVPATEVWMPDTTLYNTGDAANYAFGNSTMTNAVLRYTGRVQVVSKPFVQTSTCKIDIKFFPFDVQHCELKFGLWTFDWNHVDLFNITDGPTFEDYIQNEQWDLSYGTFCRHVIKYECCTEKYVDVTVYLGLRRKPLYYMYKLVMPIVLLSALSMVGFLMPYNVGVVKANLSITLILSMTVFLLLVAETIPRTSEGLPLISEYYIVIMVLIAVSTAMNVAVLNIFHRHQDKEEVHEVPRWLRTLVLKYLAKLLCMECARKDLLNRVEHEEKADANRVAMLKKQRWLAARYGTSYVPLMHEANMNHVRTCNASSDININMLNSGVDSGRSRPNPLQDLDGFAENLSDEADIRLTKLETNTEGILRHLKTARRRRDRAHRVQREWALVATVTDRLLFYFYACFTVTMSLVILFIRPSMQHLDSYSLEAIVDCNSSSQQP